MLSASVQSIDGAVGENVLAEAHPSFAGPIDQLRAAGIGIIQIIAIIVQYGPALLTLIQEIIDAFSKGQPLPPVPKP